MDFDSYAAAAGRAVLDEARRVRPPDLWDAAIAGRKKNAAGVLIAAFTLVLVGGVGALWFTSKDAGETVAGEPPSTSAGPTRLTPVNEPPTFPPASVVSEECAAAALEPAPPAESVGRTRVVLDTIGTLPGDTVGFSWVIDPELEPATVDWAVVDCWTGNQWHRAWAAVDLFSKRGGPTAIALVDHLGFNLVGHTNTEGALTIPDDAPQGWYRFRHSIAVCRNGCSSVEGVAPFFVGFELIGSDEDG